MITFYFFHDAGSKVLMYNIPDGMFSDAPSPLFTAMYRLVFLMV